MKQGTIIKIISNRYTVLHDKISYILKPRGLFKFNETTLCAGDEVLFEYDENTKHGNIIEVLPRKNRLIRPSVANVDYAFIVMSTITPDFSSYLIDKLIANAAINNIEPVILISKCEFINEEIIKIMANYALAGYKVIDYSAKQNINLDKIKKLLDGKKVVLCGQSGAGKSSLVNSLANVKLKDEGEYSISLGRGKHKTREVELLKVEGGFIADTPGFSSLDLQMPPISFARIFKDFDALASKCKFNTCMHLNEPKCAIKEAVKNGIILKQRYDNYVVLANEVIMEDKESWKKK